MSLKVIFIPGNGGGKTTDNWFPYIKSKLEQHKIAVVAKNFPDSQLARARYWLSYLQELGADEKTILIGHSSGAIAAMRYAQNHTILGSILVGTYYTDLGIDTEKQSGYFDSPWQWENIKKNQQWIIQFNSTDDPWIPIAEARYVHQKLQTEYYEYTDQGHFGGDYEKLEFPKMWEVLQEKLKLNKSNIKS